MKTFKMLFREAYAKIKAAKTARHKTPPSETELAYYYANALGRREKDKLLERTILYGNEEEVLRDMFLLGADVPVEEGALAPHFEAEKAKMLVTEPAGEDFLDAVVEFTGSISRVIRISGDIITCAGKGELLPIGVFRDREETAAHNVVELAKAAQGLLIEARIDKVGDDIINLTLYLRYKRTNRPMYRERLGLIADGREFRSSVTHNGKILFDNLKIRDYQIDLIRKGESRCIAKLSLRTCQ